MPQTEMNLGEFLESIEDGRFAEDVTEAIKSLVVDMRNIARASGGKPKGGITIAIALKLNKQAFEVDASFATKRPKPVREGSIMFAGADGTLTPRDAAQVAMEFTPALGAGDVRTDAVPEKSPVRMVG